MIIDCWMFCKTKHANTAFTGTGASKYPGRWNSSGTKIIYTATSIPLAILELLVHMEDPALLSFYSLIKVQIHSTDIVRLGPDQLPDDWQKEPPSISTRTIGDRWISKNESIGLMVPSVVVPEDFNILLNPNHPDFGTLFIGKPESYPLDPRLFVIVHQGL